MDGQLLPVVAHSAMTASTRTLSSANVSWEMIEAISRGQLRRDEITYRWCVRAPLDALRADLAARLYTDADIAAAVGALVHFSFGPHGLQQAS